MVVNRGLLLSYKDARFQVLTAVKMSVLVFWVVTPFSGMKFQAHNLEDRDNFIKNSEESLRTHAELKKCVDMRCQLSRKENKVVG